MNTIRMSSSLDPDQARRIWVETVCKGYQQTTLVDKELSKYHGIFIAEGGTVGNCLELFKNNKQEDLTIGQV